MKESEELTTTTTTTASTELPITKIESSSSQHLSQQPLSPIVKRKKTKKRPSNGKLLSSQLSSSSINSQQSLPSDNESIASCSSSNSCRTFKKCHCFVSIQKGLQQAFHLLQRKVPMLKTMTTKLNNLPFRKRILYLLLWFVGKPLVSFFFLHSFVSYISSSSSSTSTMLLANATNTDMLLLQQQQQQRVLSAEDNNNNILYNNNNHRPRKKVLYIVTSLAEYNSGKRATVKGQDRLKEVFLPVLVDSVESIITTPATIQNSDDHVYDFDVDVYLILAYQLSAERETMIRKALPKHVGLQIWDEACPLGYDKTKHRNSKPTKIDDNTRALARQHRYVIKDKLSYYDIFIALEDDMRISYEHVQNYVLMSEQINKLRLDKTFTPSIYDPTNKNTIPFEDKHINDPYHQDFYNKLTKEQLNRVIPGFIRVEVLLDKATNGPQTQLDPIPIDYTHPKTFTATDISNNNIQQGLEDRHFNPRICCNVQMSPNIGTPVHPHVEDVVIWETNIKALSVRKLPLPPSMSSSSSSSKSTLDWVGILPGPGKRLLDKYKIGGYWSGRNGAFGKDFEKPSGGKPDIFGQQGGWVLTKEQIMRLNLEYKTNDETGTSGLCMGNFLPPFDKPWYNEDGQESKNVEYWSGGYQLFTGVAGGCNMQRVISLHPDYISKHFLYHVANNKQKQLNRERLVLADHLLGQLNTIKKSAENEILAL